MEDPKQDTPLAAEAQAGGPPRRSITLKKPSILTSGRGNGSIPAALIPAPTGVPVMASTPTAAAKTILAPAQPIVVDALPQTAVPPSAPVQPNSLAEAEPPKITKTEATSETVAQPMPPTEVTAESTPAPSVEVQPLAQHPEHRVLKAPEPAPEAQPSAEPPVQAELQKAPEIRPIVPSSPAPEQKTQSAEPAEQKILFSENPEEPALDKKSQNKLELKKQHKPEEPTSSSIEIHNKLENKENSDNKDLTIKNNESNTLRLKTEKEVKKTIDQPIQTLDKKPESLQAQNKQPTKRLNILAYLLPLLLIAVIFLGASLWYSQKQSSGPLSLKAKAQATKIEPTQASSTQESSDPVNKSKDLEAQQWINSLHIQAVLGSDTKAKILINDKTYKAGDIVDPSLQIVFNKADPDFVYFSDSKKRVYRVRR